MESGAVVVPAVPETRLSRGSPKVGLLLKTGLATSSSGRLCRGRAAGGRILWWDSLYGTHAATRAFPVGTTVGGYRNARAAL
ncbi:hypothetical protein CCO02nite_15880 [Cellulomonas composti]|uniref:Uncharacterized protein n=1 Tax=Cellulomonas composti TaxID=266130 RepID=A0A511JAB7_9CELL|nr:hypothetical protein CCO02nite_15880 [Cellulomonas composti]